MNFLVMGFKEFMFSLVADTMSGPKNNYPIVTNNQMKKFFQINIYYFL